MSTVEFQDETKAIASDTCVYVPLCHTSKPKYIDIEKDDSFFINYTDVLEVSDILRSFYYIAD